MSEKSEQPTLHRLREARRKGQFPRARLLTIGATFLGAAAATCWGEGSQERLFVRWTEQLLLGAPQSPRAALEQALTRAVGMSLPGLLGASVGAAAVIVATQSFELSPQLLAPRWNRLSVSQGLKRLFSFRRNGREMAWALVTAGALCTWVVFHLQSLLPDSIRAISHAQGHRWAVLPLVGFVAQGGALVVAIGIVDLLLATRRHRLDLRMSKHEVKEEFRSQEGNEQVKAVRKAIHQQVNSGGPSRGVASASVVVVNPTHLAVALRYAPSEAVAPYLVAKGQESDASEIRRLAQLKRIPIVRDVPLARSLIHFDVGEAIPEELYEATAAVLRLALDGQSPLGDEGGKP